MCNWCRFTFRITLLLLSIFSLFNAGFAQHVSPPPAEILHEIEGLKYFRRVLYVAAHPDDENTRLISYLEFGNHTETAYISLTRGSGGQNLIGPEKGKLLGVIRTHELLEARSIDHGQQFFTNALDFGYSKTSEETFEKWNRENVLRELVTAIRHFKPDVMITRFPPNRRAGHGHHAASAILAEEAFAEAAKSDYITNNEPWQVSQLYFNTSSWWYKDIDSIAKTDSTYFKLDVGGFQTLSGKWHGEIAAESRSMHKSQGFGSGKQRGERFEYLQIIEYNDEFPSNGLNDGFIQWNQYENGNQIEEQIDDLISTFDVHTPSKSIPGLIRLKHLLQKRANLDARLQLKIEKIDEIIVICTGLYLSVHADKMSYTRGSAMEISVNAVNPSNETILIKQVQIGKDSYPLQLSTSDNVNVSQTITHTLASQLFDPANDNIHYPGNQFNVVECNITLEVLEERITTALAVNYQWVDRVKGELHSEAAFLPEVLVSFTDKTYITKQNGKLMVEVKLESVEDSVHGDIRLNLNREHWKVVPELHQVDLSPGIFQTVSFEVEAISSNQKDICEAVFSDGQNEYVQYVEKIKYDHIPEISVLMPNQVSFLSLDIDPGDMKIAYIPGAGDEMVSSLQRVGYTVEELRISEISISELKKFDAVVCGIRAYNINSELFKLHEVFLSYMRSGGNFIVQYNTSRRIEGDQISPYKLHLSRNRVTDERAKVTIMHPDHPILNTPLSISTSDFDGWVQERGLYFPDEWGSEFTALLSWSDKNEDPLTGSLLVADYGEGAFIYTGISFFRQLPAGVPGAYRLFSNLLHYSPNEK